MPPKSALPTINYSQSHEMMGLTLSAPAALAFIAYIILGLVIVLPFDIPMTDQQTGEEVVIKYDFVQRIILLLLMAIPIALSVYSINCMMVGKCVLWSYVVSLVTILWIIMFVVAAMAYTFKK